MRAHRPMINLALIGFMGTGKSAVGRLVAKQLRFDFLDTDACIEAQTGLRIAELFARAGEAAFREHERRLVDDLGRMTRTVIATGGGLAANEQNLASLKQHALVVCLWASPETIWDRVADQSHRPLLRDPDPLAKIRLLLAQREPFYRQADVLVNTDRRSIKEVAHQITHQYRLARNAAPPP
ncbi:MAG: shikimate kinase [Verrucomicrobia bacterium]|nr:shikimate kinase [Verrucomicrobiota bacterium]